jgi:hypothetical protein
MKLSIFPRKLSNTYIYDNDQTEYENVKGIKDYKQKMSRVLSLDKQLFKTARANEKDDKSTLNRGHIYNSKIRISSLVSSSRKLYGSSQNLIASSKDILALSVNKHEIDTC